MADAATPASFWDADADSGKTLTPLPDESKTMALAWGVERFPWLAEPPPRPSDAESCSDCMESGRFGDGPVLCHACEGLGWLPPAAALQLPLTPTRRG